MTIPKHIFIKKSEHISERVIPFRMYLFSVKQPVALQVDEYKSLKILENDRFETYLKVLEIAAKRTEAVLPSGRLGLGRRICSRQILFEDGFNKRAAKKIYC